MKAIVSILLLFLLAFSQMALAEDRSLDEILRWFPYGYYSSLFHFDKAEYLSSCPESMQSHVARCERQFKCPYILPLSMTGKFDSVTTARKGELGIKMNYRYREDGTIEQVNRKCAYVCWIDGKPYGAWEPTKALIVFRFSNLRTLVRKALVNGELSRLDTLNGKHVIYQIKNKGKRQNRYFYTSDSGELLSTRDLKLLNDMIRTGQSNEVPIFQRMELKDLEDIADDGGFLWSYDTQTRFLRNTLEYVRTRDPSSKSIDDLEKRIASSIQYRINHCNWKGAGIETHQVILFGTEDRAKEFRNKVLTGKGIILDTGYPKTYLYGRLIGFRPTVYKFAEIRKDNGIKLNMTLDGLQLTQSRVDDEKTLVAFLKLIEKEAR